MDWLDKLSRFWPHLAAGFDLLAALLASIHALLHKRDSRAATLWLGISGFSRCSARFYISRLVSTASAAAL